MRRIHRAQPPHTTLLQNRHSPSLISTKKANSYLLKTFPILENLPTFLAKAGRLHIFLQIKTCHFYQVKDLIKLDLYEKYIDEEAKLEYFHGISSI